MFFPHKSHSNCEELREGKVLKLSRFWECLCVGPDTYVRVPLTKLRSCDSLHAKMTRTQRAFHKHSTSSNGHKLTMATKESFNIAMFF